jgi:crotonobetainyl-CoA hydratase
MAAWPSLRQARAFPIEDQPVSFEHCKVERDGRTLIVTIDRPDRMNALHPPANAELARVFDDFAADPDLWVAILTGAGPRAFCAGNDLRWQAEGNAVTVPPTGFAGLTSRWDLDKPVIAAVNGVAMGGGFEIALACDIILAAETASFALPEPKVGLAALAGGLHRLPRTIGVKRAMGMILTGRSVPAAEGKALGFVHDVVAADALMDAAKALAATICELSPMSIRASKQVVARSLDTASLREAYDGQMAHPAVQALWRSEDLREGPLAFAQKRKPDWKGK